MNNTGCARNIFSRLFRRERGEDHLTESLAVLCERSPPFMAEVVKLFAPELAECGTLNIATQSSHRLGGNTKFIDLEIWAETEGGDRTATAFVEIKWRAGEHFSAGADNVLANQNRNYEEILWANRESLGGKVGLFSLTPAFNPLGIDLDPAHALTFFPPRNIFWSQIGKTAIHVGQTTDDSVFRYLAEHFVAYLAEIGLMTDSRLTIQDVFVASQYMRVKRKLWPALQRVADHMGKAINKGVTNSFSTASTQESNNDRFCVYRYLAQESGFAIFAGLISDDTEGAWVATWIEVNPRNGEQFDAVSAAIKKAFPDHITTSDDSLGENRWVIFNKGSGWWIASKSKRLASYAQGDDGIEIVSRDLVTWVDELLSVKNLVSLGAPTAKKAG